MEQVKIEGGTINVRTNRIMQIQDFLESGETEREIIVQEYERLTTVRAALHNAIRDHPYFRDRCYIIARNMRLYLVRR